MTVRPCGQEYPETGSEPVRPKKVPCLNYGDPGPVGRPGFSRVCYGPDSPPIPLPPCRSGSRLSGVLGDGYLSHRGVGGGDW